MKKNIIKIWKSTIEKILSSGMNIHIYRYTFSHNDNEASSLPRVISIGLSPSSSLQGFCSRLASETAVLNSLPGTNFSSWDIFVEKEASREWRTPREPLFCH